VNSPSGASSRVPPFTPAQPVVIRPRPVNAFVRRLTGAGGLIAFLRQHGAVKASVP